MAFGGSLYRKGQTTMALRGMFVTSLLLYVVSVDGYTGVSKRKDGVGYHCELSFLGSSPRQRIWVGTYRTEELAALACDVVFYYTNRPFDEYNLEFSAEAIWRNCKSRSFYQALQNWNDRRKFIKAEANALISSLSDFHWEDVILVPSTRQKSETFARRVVSHFLGHAGRVQEFMAWLMDPSNEQQILAVHAQKSSQQLSEAYESRLHSDEVLVPEVDLAFNVDDIVNNLEFVQARPGSDLWILLVGSALPLIFELFETIRIGKKRSRHFGRLLQSTEEETAKKRLKVNHPRNYLSTGRRAWLTAINYYIQNGEWQCTGFDLDSKTWEKLPPFSYLCPPNAPFVKKSSVCGHGGLMCAEVAKGELVVFNPLTMHTMALPPLLHPRSSVLVHILVDPATKAYKVIVAGSSTQSDKHLSKKMEVFDSQTSKWEEAPDLPGPAFGLNEYQTGVCVNGILYLIIFLKGHKPCNRGVVAFDVKDGKWLENMACPIPFSSYWNTLQLVETNGKVYLFSEQDVAVPSSKCCNHVCVSMHLMDHCIDVLEISGRGVACHWRNVVRVTKLGGRQFQVYPEPMCVPFGKDKLCIFNPLTCDGVVYDMQNGGQCDVLRPPPPDCKGDSFFSLNPASFTLQLSPECQSNQ